MSESAFARHITGPARIVMNSSGGWGGHRDRTWGSFDSRACIFAIDLCHRFGVFRDAGSTQFNIQFEIPTALLQIGRVLVSRSSSDNGD